MDSCAAYDDDQSKTPLSSTPPIDQSSPFRKQGDQSSPLRKQGGSVLICPCCSHESDDKESYATHMLSHSQDAPNVERRVQECDDPVWKTFKVNQKKAIKANQKANQKSESRGCTKYMFNKMLSDFNLELAGVPPNGYCFLSSMSITLKEHGIELTASNLAVQVMNHMRAHSSTYMEFALDYDKISEEEFIAKCAKFFEEADYTHEYVDICINTVADALGVNILIFQKNESYVSMTEVFPRSPYGYGYGSNIFVYLNFDPPKSRKGKRIFNAHYSCYLKKQYYKPMKKHIQNQYVLRSVDHTLDEKMAWALHKELNSDPSNETKQNEKSKETPKQAKQDRLSEDVRYVKYHFSLSTYIFILIILPKIVTFHTHNELKMVRI